MKRSPSGLSQPGLRRQVSSAEDRFRTIFEWAPEAYYLNDLRGRFVDGNRAAEELVGYEREELIGKSFLELDLLHESCLTKAASHLAKNIEGYPTGPDVFTLVRRDGEHVEVEVRAHPVTIDGEPLVLSTARDVTENRRLARKLERAREKLEARVTERTAELKHINEMLEREVAERWRTEQELRESEERYRTVIEQSMDCIFVADVETMRILDANRSFRELLGYDAAEIQDLTLYDFIAHPREDVDRKSRQLIEKGRLSIGERNYRCKDGTIVPLEINASMVSTGGRTVFCVVSRDVSERKAAEQEREQMQAQLLQAQKMEAVGIFAGGVAHDFNNMMTAILGRTQLACLHLDESHRALKEVREIEKAALSATDLSRQLLLFSRQQPTRIRPLNVISVIDGMVGMLSRLMGEDVQVSLEGKRDTWTVQADKGNLEQLVMNLATNARDAMPHGGTLRVHVWNINVKQGGELARKAGRTGRFVRISVSDDGVGMSPETMERIFDPFYTTKTTSGGTGLGLSVVRGIVEQHDGWIDVETAPGRGTDFRVYLPAMPDLEAEEETQEFSIDRYMGQGQRVLLVEDDAQVRDFAVKTLGYGHYEVAAASSAEEALSILERDGAAFDLVFTDIVLPGMTGVDLVKILGERWPGLHVLLTSGYADDKTRWHDVIEKGYPFLPKPYDVAQLLRSISKTLRAATIT